MHFQLLDPLSEDVVDTFKDSIDVADIPATALACMKELSYYFPVHPAKDRLHLVIHVPRRKHQPFTPSCQRNICIPPK